MRWERSKKYVKIRIKEIYFSRPVKRLQATIFISLLDSLDCSNKICHRLLDFFPYLSGKVRLRDIFEPNMPCENSTIYQYFLKTNLKLAFYEIFICLKQCIILPWDRSGSLMGSTTVRPHRLNVNCMPRLVCIRLVFGERFLLENSCQTHRFHFATENRADIDESFSCNFYYSQNKFEQSSSWHKALHCLQIHNPSTLAF